GHRHPFVDVSGEVDRHRWRSALGAAEHRRISEVDPVRRELVVGRGPGVGQVGKRTGGQIVDHVDLVSFGQQSVHQRGPDEPGTAGDEDPHDPPSRCSPTPTVPPDTRRFGPTTARSPSTARSSIRAPAPTAASQPRMARSITAPAPTRAPGRSTEPFTETPAPISTPAPSTER